MATRQKQLFIWALIVLSVLAVLACCTLFASISSASELSCFTAKPAIDVTFKPALGVSGKLNAIPVPKKSDVLVSTFWIANGEIIRIGSSFSYTSQLGYEYPVYKIRYDHIVDGEMKSVHEVDYTNSCSNAYGRELTAGYSFQSEEKFISLQPNRDNRIRMQIWSGQ